jgi:hypothetical protein
LNEGKINWKKFKTEVIQRYITKQQNPHLMLLCGTRDWRTEEILNWEKFKNEVIDCLGAAEMEI